MFTNLITPWIVFGLLSLCLNAVPVSVTTWNNDARGKHCCNFENWYMYIMWCQWLFLDQKQMHENFVNSSLKQILWTNLVHAINSRLKDLKFTTYNNWKQATNIRTHCWAHSSLCINMLVNFISFFSPAHTLFGDPLHSVSFSISYSVSTNTTDLHADVELLSKPQN